MNDHHWMDTAPDYVLGALEREETSAFETHLASCTLCRDAVAEYREVVAGLTLFAPSVEPPLEMRARVLAAARADRVTPVPRRPVVVPWLAVAASLAMALFAGGAYLSMRGERDALLAERQDALTRVRSLTVARARQDSLFDAILSPDVDVATLTSTEAQPRVRVFWNRERGVMLVTAFELPAAPAGRDYQVWGIAPGRDPVSFGVFNTDADGRAVLLQDVPADLQLVATAITEEPAGGSPQPTTEPFLVGEWVPPDA